MTRTSQRVVRLYTTKRRSHPDYDVCKQVRDMLDARKVNYEEIPLVESDYEISKILLGRGGAELPILEVREKGRISEEVFGLNEELLKSL